jgi:uncharacterized protein (DUF427 family)
MEDQRNTVPAGSPGAIRIERDPRTVIIRRHDAVIASTKNGLLVHGLSETPVYYIPRQDVYAEHLTETGARPGPGGVETLFWSVTASGGGVDNAVWMLVKPEGEYAPLAGHLGFDPAPFNITVD